MAIPAIKLSNIEKNEILEATGDIHLWSCDVHEFFNECHNKSDGKFCGGSGGSGGGGGKGSAEKGSKEEEAAWRQEEKDIKKSSEIAHKLWGQDDVSFKALRNKTKKQDSDSIDWAAIGAAVTITAIYLQISGVPVLQTVGRETLGNYQAKRAAAKLAGAPVRKGIYTATGKNGKVIKLVNHSDQLTTKQRDILLKGFKDTYDNDPLPGEPPPILNIWENHPDAPNSHGFFTANAAKQGRPDLPGPREININRGVAFDLKTQKSDFAQLPHNGTRWAMPSMKKQRFRYTIAHEYGHMRDTAYETLEDAKGSAEGAIYRNKRSELASSKNIRGDVLGVRGNGISHYGLSKKRGSFGFITDEINDRETYAESYAEWSVNNGKTGNKASKAFAKEFNWTVNTDRFKEVPTGPASSIGERIVRTAEGKERYGVSIGQKIPKDKETASAMDSVELVSIAAIKLVNSKNYALAALELEK